jgi:hypothetical protein
LQATGAKSPTGLRWQSFGVLVHPGMQVQAAS